MTYQSGDKVFDTFEEMMADYEASLTRWQRLTLAVQRPVNRLTRRVTDAKNKIVWASQRVTRGWDDRAVYFSLDDHLCKQLGEQLVKMAEISHGFPPNYGNPDAGRYEMPCEHDVAASEATFAQWTGDLRAHGNALQDYARNHHERHTPEEWDAVYVPAQDALRWVADNLASLWD